MVLKDLSEYKGFFIQNESIKPLVSVIIPVYNVDKYLAKCLGSLIKQTFKDFEIICINDGSSDNSLEILNTFKENDSRIKIINQEKNKGVSAARNAGINSAEGEYLCFIDSDDWVDENYIDALYKAIDSNHCDISISRMVREKEKAKKYRFNFAVEKVYSSLVDKVKVCKIPDCCYACGKLFKKDLIKDILFKEGVFFEDVIWTPQIVALSQDLVTVPNTTYHYRVNKNSIVRKIPGKKKQMDSYKANKFAINFLSGKGIRFSEKEVSITKEIKHFCGIPILRIKENNNCLKYMLFDLIPVFKKTIPEKLAYKNYKRFFFIKSLDAHWYIELFKLLKISFKNKKMFQYTETTEYGLNQTPRDKKLIVSLASFPDRINTVHLTINTLLNQTVKPDAVILWLAEEQFPNKENDLPEDLLKQKDLGLTIKWCEDLKSYKKLIPALREFPEDIIITADDDLYYRKDWLESLYSEYLKNPNYIYTRRACKMKLKNNVLTVEPHYANTYYKPTFRNQLLGGAGTLYPPHSLHKDVLDTELIKSLIPTHDDIYFWIMAVINGTKICLVKNKDSSIYNVEGSQNTALCKQHRSTGMRPKEAFARILEHYPLAYERIEEESING